MSSRKVFYSAVLIVAVLAFAAGCSAIMTPSTGPGGAGGSPPVTTGGQGGAVSPQTAAVQPAGQPPRGITVVGIGQASGTPDVANVNIGVETTAPSVQQAVADNRTKMTALLDALKALGVADKDIQTSNYGVFTERPPVPGPEGGAGAQGAPIYHVNNQVNVTVRDVSKLGDVLDKVVAAGANNIYGVSFSVADPTKLQADARTKAIADAKARADSLARLAGVTLGDVLSISENVSGPGPFFDGRAAAGLGGGGGAPIQPGELDINMSVQVTYAIK